MACHSGEQVAAPQPVASNAERACCDAMYTTPPATAGLDWKAGPPSEPFHRGWQADAGNAFSLPSFESADVCDPTYTVPRDTVGESTIWASEVDRHSGTVQSALPHPDAG